MKNDKIAFTLTESTTHAGKAKIFKKNAFTLAEVLITLGVIGVVAMLVLPHFIEDMSMRMYSERQANIAQKITKSTELMIVNGDYADIYNTEDYVNKLSKYIKIMKRCDSEHIADCWPSKTVKTPLAEKYMVSNAKTGADLHFGGKDNDTPNVGLVLADGASIILAFNPKTTTPLSSSGFISSTKDLPVGGGKTKNYSYTSNATAQIDFVMDVNGKSGPNEESNIFNGNYTDIRRFKVATFDGCGGAKVPGIGCVFNLGTSYSPINTCNDTTWDSHLTTNNSCANNAWAGAKKACADLGMTMPDYATIKQIRESQISGLPTPGWVWYSRECNQNDGCVIWFEPGNAGNGNSNKRNKWPAVCLGD